MPPECSARVRRGGWAGGGSRRRRWGGGSEARARRRRRGGAGGGRRRGRGWGTAWTRACQWRRAPLQGGVGGGRMAQRGRRQTIPPHTSRTHRSAAAARRTPHAAKRTPRAACRTPQACSRLARAAVGRGRRRLHWELDSEALQRGGALQGARGAVLRDFDGLRMVQGSSQRRKLRFFCFLFYSLSGPKSASSLGMCFAFAQTRCCCYQHWRCPKYWLESASKALVSRTKPSLAFARADLVLLKSEDQEHKCLD
jgi:hypothetical protein